jgi:hypothetical protein
MYYLLFDVGVDASLHIERCLLIKATLFDQGDTIVHLLD